MSDIDDQHLRHRNKNPLPMSMINSCTRVQLCSYDDHYNPSMGSSALYAKNNNKSYNYTENIDNSKKFPKANQVLSGTNRYVNSSA
jgi:hypothetical protein